MLGKKIVNFIQATTQILILSGIQRGALQAHCLSTYIYFKAKDYLSKFATDKQGVQKYLNW